MAPQSLAALAAYTTKASDSVGPKRAAALNTPASGACTAPADDQQVAPLAVGKPALLHLPSHLLQSHILPCLKTPHLQSLQAAGSRTLLRLCGDLQTERWEGCAAALLQQLFTSVPAARQQLHVDVCATILLGLWDVLARRRLAAQAVGAASESWPNFWNVAWQESCAQFLLACEQAKPRLAAVWLSVVQKLASSQAAAPRRAFMQAAVTQLSQVISPVTAPAVTWHAWLANQLGADQESVALASLQQQAQINNLAYRREVVLAWHAWLEQPQGAAAQSRYVYWQQAAAQETRLVAAFDVLLTLAQASRDSLSLQSDIVDTLHALGWPQVAGAQSMCIDKLVQACLTILQQLVEQEMALLPYDAFTWTRPVLHFVTCMVHTRQQLFAATLTFLAQGAAYFGVAHNQAIWHVLQRRQCADGSLLHIADFVLYALNATYQGHFLAQWLENVQYGSLAMQQRSLMLIAHIDKLSATQRQALLPQLLKNLQQAPSDPQFLWPLAARAEALTHLLENLLQHTLCQADSELLYEAWQAILAQATQQQQTSMPQVFGFYSRAMQALWLMLQQQNPAAAAARRRLKRRSLIHLLTQLGSQRRYLQRLIKRRDYARSRMVRERLMTLLQSSSELLGLFQSEPAVETEGVDCAAQLSAEILYILQHWRQLWRQSQQTLVAQKAPLQQLQRLWQQILPCHTLQPRLVQSIFLQRQQLWSEMHTAAFAHLCNPCLSQRKRQAALSELQDLLADISSTELRIMLRSIATLWQHTAMPAAGRHLYHALKRVQNSFATHLQHHKPIYVSAINFAQDMAHRLRTTCPDVDEAQLLSQTRSLKAFGNFWRSIIKFVQLCLPRLPLPEVLPLLLQMTQEVHTAPAALQALGLCEPDTCRQLLARLAAMPQKSLATQLRQQLLDGVLYNTHNFATVLLYPQLDLSCQATQMLQCIGAALGPATPAKQAAKICHRLLPIVAMRQGSWRRASMYHAMLTWLPRLSSEACSDLLADVQQLCRS